ncbi:MAG: hypothetical protein IJ680_03650 [Paludibacteraceae bacterium]|nr:hypothetical protein [Paludibacteraceae bacterium]
MKHILNPHLHRSFQRAGLALLMLSVCIGVYAWQLPVKGYTPDQYMGGTQNWQIRQQQNGWIYVANNYGLLEFDGSRWSLYGIWNASIVRSIDIDEQGVIYAGATNEFGRFAPTSAGTLEFHPLSTQLADDNVRFGEVWSICHADNHVYFLSRHTLFCYRGDSLVYSLESDKRLVQMAAVQDVVYIAASDGVYVLNDRKLERIDGSDLLAGAEICGIRPMADGRILIGTDFKGLFVVEHGRVSPFATEVDDFIIRNQLYAVDVCSDKIALGTVLSGLVVTDLNGHPVCQSDIRSGLHDNTVLSVFFDRDGSLWVGLDQGIDCVMLHSARQMLYGRQPFYGSGYAAAVMGHQAYFGTNQGLYVCRTDSTDLGKIDGSMEFVQGSQGQVWRLDTLHETLLCSHNRGLYVLRNNHLESLCTDHGFWAVKAWIRPDMAVAGSYSGFYMLRWSGGAWHVEGAVKGYDATSRMFEVDQWGRIWTIGERGVVRLSIDTLTWTCQAVLEHRMSDPTDYQSINRLDGRIVVSSRDYCGVVTDDGQLQADDSLFSQLSGRTYYPAIMAGEEGLLWYVDGEQLKLRLPSGKTLTAIRQPNYFVAGFPFLLPIDDRRVVTGCVSGFELIDARQTENLSQMREAQVSIRRIYSTQPADSLVYGTSYPLVDQPVSLSYQCASIRIEYGGSCASDNDVEYSVWLSPIEVENMVWTTSMVKEYTHLNEGSYTINVKMRDVATGQVVRTSMDFVVRPPWYRSWWAWVVYTILYIAVMWLIYVLVRRHMVRKNLQLEQQKNEQHRRRELELMADMQRQELQISRLQQEQVEYELKNKSQELSNALLNKITHTEFVKDIKHDLTRIGTDVRDAHSEQALHRLSLLQTKLTNSIGPEVDLETFRENFDYANDRFLQKLAEHYPNLNKSERRLCVYIVSGLQSKEIAPLMSLSVRGVEMIRYRMRKKMNLAPHRSLEDCFKELSES